jgi:1-acyl-sn-glycerol-3-phosphate acyltransferase
VNPKTDQPLAHPPVEPTTAFYRLIQLLARIAWRLSGGIHVEGLDNVPASGPFLLIANHQSFVDPVFSLSVVPRRVYAMAKSTQFTDRFVGWILRRVCSFPVRRYQVDAQAVRITLRHLERGRGVAIFIEGERTWDGRLQEPKSGTVRLALRAGVPIIPCVITGTYDIWPRWSRRPVRGRATVRFLEPLRLPQLSGAANRAATPAAAETIMSAIRCGLQTGSVAPTV